MSVLNTAVCSGWCCTDCLFFIAYGQTPADWSEAEVNEFVARIDARNPAGSVTLGMGRESHDCVNNAGETAGDLGGECECETQTFSWSSCDVCGSHLGGERHAVTFWV